MIVGWPAQAGTRRHGTNTAHDKRCIGCYSGEARKAAGHSDGCGRCQRHKPPNGWSAGSNSVGEAPRRCRSGRRRMEPPERPPKDSRQATKGFHKAAPTEAVRIAVSRRGAEERRRVPQHSPIGLGESRKLPPGHEAHYTTQGKRAYCSGGRRCSSTTARKRPWSSKSVHKKVTSCIAAC